MKQMILSLIQDKLQILNLSQAPCRPNGHQKGRKLLTLLRPPQNKNFAQADKYFFMRN